MNTVLFDCDWNAMSKGNRKILNIIMTFGQITPRLQVEPFFVINREYFAQVGLNF